MNWNFIRNLPIYLHRVDAMRKNTSTKFGEPQGQFQLNSWHNASVGEGYLS